jgi:nucleoside-diphosphate-sugar epimerase
VHVLITGGAGFIGSHLADALCARGDRVTVVDDLSTGSIANIEHLVERDAITFVEGSVTDPELVRELLDGVDTCFHLASAVGVQLIVDRPLESLQRNVAGMQNVVEAAHGAGARLVLASTSEIYGKGGTKLLHEDCDRVLGAPTKARWTYANAKAYGEMLAYGYHSEYGAENTVVRFFNTVGPRQTGMYGMVVPSFVRQALRGDDITVFGDGTQSRCFTHIRDSIDAILRIAECDAALGRPFNVGSTTEVSIQELAEEVVRMTGSESRIRHVPYEEAYGEGFEELGSRRPDTTAIEQMTGWRAQHTVEEAIDDIIACDRAAVPPVAV